MLASLELNESKTDFKIPLWASPYAAKFEALLTSIINNKVVKQKLSGGSYVLGSPEGFKIKEGEDANEVLKNSNIVVTKSFDATKGLQPMRYDKETNKILPAQIMIPFKFRDEAGKILNVQEFVDSEGKLDSSKIPDKLLQLFGFRIPTQERNSMAAVEIVGFLPEAMGDLMLAPRDWTKQMGSDFDVDKLYTYMYNHYYKDGKLHTNFISDKKRINFLIAFEKENLKDLKAELKIALTPKEEAILDSLITNENKTNDDFLELMSLLKGRTSEELRTQIKNSVDRLSVLNRSYKASQQNKLLDIHLRVMTSTNPDIIASIVALDSFGEFTDLAKDVYNVRLEQGLVEATTTILSDTYQRTKYINATAGKTGVGSFSLDSTFNAVAQGKNLVYTNLSEENEKQLFKDGRVPTAKEILDNNENITTFGSVSSRGDMSNIYTLRSQELIAKAKKEGRALTKEEKQSLKFKSTIIRALQSSAVDNEKEQLLDKLNINDETFDAIRALTILGFEEQEIAGLLTQEIIWEYTYVLRDSRSSLAKYQENIEEVIFEQLATKYDPANRLASLDADTKELMSSSSGTQLMSNLRDKKLKPLTNDKEVTPDFNLEQLLLVRKFQKLTEIGKTIKQLQSAINAGSKGVPKSLIETSSKVDQIESLLDSKVFNAEKLLGRYENGTLTNPTTINGFASKYGTMMANTVYSKYFPYKNEGFKTLVKEILSHTPKGVDVSVSKQTETQEEVFKDVRSYLFANNNTNLFTGDPDVERARLFIDTPNNKSLATIIDEVKNKSWFLSNGFLNKLTTDVNQNGKISRINFEAATAENLDERNIYDGFAYLLTKNIPIGMFNGINYTTRTLAQELVMAAFLEGGNQGSKQYLKYIPITYLKALGFDEYLQSIPFDFTTTFKGFTTDLGTVYTAPSNFTRQYFQNHPDKVKTVSLDDIQGKDTTPPLSFKLNEKAMLSNFVKTIDPLTGNSIDVQTMFVAMKDTKDDSKYALYEFDSTTHSYVRIPVLSGSYGFVSYNSQSTAMPIEKQNAVPNQVVEVSAPGYSLTQQKVEPTNTFNVNVVNNPVIETKDLLIDKTLSGTKEALDDLINNLEDSPTLSNTNRLLLQHLRTIPLPSKFKLVYGKSRGLGKYGYESQTLTINLSHSENRFVDDLATTLSHELIHAFTGDLINKYTNGEKSSLTEEQIRLIENLEQLRKSYIATLNTQEFEKFKSDYEAWRLDPDNADTTFFGGKGKFYGAINLREFVTMALTDTKFQEYLNNVKDPNSSKTLWEQIKEVISNIIQSLGIDVKDGYLLKNAIKNSMDLIATNTQTNTSFASLLSKYGSVPDVSSDNLLPSYKEEVLKLPKEERQKALTREEFVSLTEQEQRTALWQIKNCR